MTAYLQTLFQFGTYKSKQGRIARQVTLYALVVVAAAGAWALRLTLEASDSDRVISMATPIAIGVFAFGCWAAFRLIQLPSFAEFLIDVEHEMNKVSWPSRGELWKASLVVILTIFVLAMVLFVYDLVWRELLALVMWDDASQIKQLILGLGG